jgi:hypothetical protein
MQNEVKTGKIQFQTLVITYARQRDLFYYVVEGRYIKLIIT